MNYIDLYEELLLGFDARVLLEKKDQLWDCKRKNDYLLNTDVHQPFSTDTNVWPTIFNFYNINKPEYTGFYQDTWEDYNILKHYCTLYSLSNRVSFYIICISLIYSCCNDNEKELWQSFLSGYNSNNNEYSLSKYSLTHSIKKDWIRIGFDVSDFWGLSALSNIHKSIKEKDTAKSLFKRKLNKYHLFSILDDSKNYKIYANKEFKLHSPFFLYSIWLCDSI